MQPKKVDLVGTKTGPDSTDKIMTTTDNSARITGRPASEPFMALPVDRGVEINGLVYGKDNKIADCGWVAEGAQINDWEVGDPTADIDNAPIPSRIGDGLVTLEEYRGFKIRTFHKRTNPFFKDVFISSLLPEDIEYAYPALPTTTHLMWNEFDVQHRINSNFTGIGNHQDQCAIVINEEPLLDDQGREIDVPYEFGRSGNDPPGPPCSSVGVRIYRTQILKDIARQGGDESTLVKYTIGHESGHCVSMPDRVCACGGPFVALMCRSDSIGPSPACLFDHTPSEYSSFDTIFIRLK